MEPDDFDQDSLIFFPAQISLGQRVELARRLAGMSQAELAKRAGIPNQSSVSRLESGETRAPSLPEMWHLAEALGLPLEELADPSPEPYLRKLLIKHHNVIEFSNTLHDVLQTGRAPLVITEEQRELIRELYPQCETQADKDALVERVGQPLIALMERYRGPYGH